MSYFCCATTFLLLLGLSIHRSECSEKIPVRAYLLNGHTKVPWKWNIHEGLSTTTRRKRDTEEGSAIRMAINGANIVLNLRLRPTTHPVTSNTIVEWVGENGERTLSRGINMDHCWFTGWVENQSDSLVSLGICDGLSGLIHSNNQTLFLEPAIGNDASQLDAFIVYPPVNGIDLKSDEVYGIQQSQIRRKRNSMSNQIDYDEDGNEITDTIHQQEEPMEYEREEEDVRDDESNSIDEDDDAVIQDSYLEIDDYDVHPPPVVIEATTLEEAEKKPGSNNQTSVDTENEVIDGYTVDKLWEGESQAVKRRKPVSTAGEDPVKHLEMALAVDHTVIKFHGKQRVRQYVLTLLNIVSAIYEDSSLEANLRLVVTRLVFYEDRKQGQVREGNSKRSLENVNAWNAGLLRKDAVDSPHDVAVWLTRYDLGGPSGYAPVAGVCDPDRSCSLNRDEGLTSAFIIAHEVGHVLGFSHDGDVSAGNDCSDEALQGSVMAPMVAATFSRFHWSRCTHFEYHFKQHNWKCLKNQPSSENNTLVHSSIQFSYSLDEQCRMEFGEGYFLCRSFALSDPCTHLWCGHKSSPQLCKTKKGPPLEGTPCGKDKWCIKGFCEPIGKRKKMVGPVAKNPRNGNWSEWSDWNTCSRTCNIGVRFRTRKCNNPKPANGGKNCKGPGEESQLCNTQPCPQWTDFRAEQCATIPALLSVNSSSLTWLPWEPSNQSMQCRLTCVALETGEVFESTDNVIDGTFCSYENPHAICIQGQCQKLGCDKRLGSAATENECGVCNGKAGDCAKASRHYSGSPRPPHRRVIVIPRGARNIRIKEEPNSSNRLALKGRNTRDWILNGTFPIREDVFTYHFIASGTRFTYSSVFGLETMRARGPLLTDVAVMIVPGLKREAANVTVTWNTPPKSHRRKNPGPGEMKKDVYWDLAGWSLCSRSCGEGTQTQVWYCRDRQTDRILRRKDCSHLNEPQIITRVCNTFSCDYRWVTGPWEGCSMTCGKEGIQMRMVYCVRTSMVTASPNLTTVEPPIQLPVPLDWEMFNRRSLSHEARRAPEVTDDDESLSEVSDKLPVPVAIDKWRPTIQNKKKKLAIENEILTWKPNAITDPALCHDNRPADTQPCNRIPCPGIWVEKTWTKCSTTCGHGQQEMLFSCVSSTGTSADGMGLSDSAQHEDEIETESHEQVKVEHAELSLDSVRNKRMKLTCGVKPHLTRPCSEMACPVNAQSQAECSDISAHCNVSLLHRYCVLPHFRMLCCQSCANYVFQ